MTIRDIEGYQRLRVGPDGDDRLVPMNMTPAGEDPMKDDPAKGAVAEWLPGDVKWSTPQRGQRRPSTMVGPGGERLYLN